METEATRVTRSVNNTISLIYYFSTKLRVAHSTKRCP